MSSQLSLMTPLGAARCQPYLDAADGDEALATDLYYWGAELAGALHSHLSYVEVLVRNSMDQQLKVWNSKQTRSGQYLTPEWTRDGQTGPLLLKLIGKGIEKSREAADDVAARREPDHKRYGTPVNHDDVVAQMVFGGWTRLLRFPGEESPHPRQVTLWNDCLKHAFPYATPNLQSLMLIGGVLESFRALRNRIAHHENLLEVDIKARLDTSLALLSYINPHYPDLVMPRNSLRQLEKEDPRKRSKKSSRR